MAVEILADLNDINTHLPEDKIQADDTNTDKLQVDAARYIRAMLAGTFASTTLAAWDTPSTTPDLIRAVAGRIIASKYYSERYAEDSDVSEYAQGLYNEANSMIGSIRSGSMVVVDINDNPIETNGLSLSSDDFWPNNTTNPPKFGMDQVFG